MGLLDEATGLTFILVLKLILILGAILYKRRLFVKAIGQIPCPKALPIVGNAFQVNCSLEDFFRRLCQWSKEFGDIYLLWIGPRPFIFLYRVEAVQPLLSSSQHTDKSLEYAYLKPWLGEGLITSNGPKWHSRRKLLTPTFHSELLKDYFKVTMKQAEIFVSCLRAEVDKQYFDIVPYAKRAALDVISECAMGYRINAQTNYNNEYVLAVHDITTISQKRFTNIWISNDAIFRLTPLGRAHDKVLKIIQDFVGNVIAKRKLEWTVSRELNINNGTTSKRPQTLLELLLQMSQDGEHLTDEDLREEVNTFMFAGHDTVGTSISWILYSLARNPVYQARILDEYKEIFGDEDVTYESVSKLVWLDACIKESWRLYPVASLIARQIYSPIKLQGYDVPIGSTVLVNSFLLHRDPRFFPEPEKYDPQRFLPDRPKYPTYAYIPFSAGSRNCIGSRFALMEIKVMLLSLLRAYEFRALDKENELRFVSKVVLENVDGIRLSINPRRSF